MSTELDISEANHPDCREDLLGKLRNLPENEKLTVYSDHDPEPVLHQFQEETSGEITWDYHEDGPEKWELVIDKEKSSDGENERLDVREMPPPERHGRILEQFSELELNSSITLVNDHDPKPLFYELRSIHGDTFEWEYLKREKQEYHVKITKTDESREMPGEASTRVDVRVIPPNDRHKTIFHRFDLLASGDAMEIVADHSPEPLRLQLREIHGEDAFEWETLSREDGEVRVLLRKNESTGSGSEGDQSGENDTLEASAEDLPELDVREYEPQKRHDLIFERYREIDAGDAFVLVNDHDPKPLYYQMKQEMDGNVEWDYLEKNEGEWKVRIGKEPV